MTELYKTVLHKPSAATLTRTVVAHSFFTNVWNLMINHTYNLYAGENEINCVRCDLNHDILIQ